MSEIVKLRTRAEIDEEAAEWTWRMEGDSVGPADREAFDSWLRQDARHRRAFEECLLALPDAVVWCWAKGKQWRRLVEPLVTEVIRL